MSNVVPIQYLSEAEMVAVADRLEANACAGKVSQLRPETAYLAQRAIRVLASAPTHDDFLRELCRSFREGKCTSATATGCITCHGHASAVYNLMMERR
jgi:hypothetical protein